MIVCALLFWSRFLILLGATEHIAYALAYAGIYTASSIFNVFNVTMNSIVTSEGAARTTMCALMAGAVLNIVLDRYLSMFWDWGLQERQPPPQFPRRCLRLCIYVTYYGEKVSLPSVFKTAVLLGKSYRKL